MVTFKRMYRFLEDLEGEKEKGELVFLTKPPVEIGGFSFGYVRGACDKCFLVVYMDRLEQTEEFNMYFETAADVQTYFNNYRNQFPQAKSVKYSVKAKKAFSEFAIRSEIGVSNLSKIAGVSIFTVKHWKKQQEEGLYNDTDGATHVSRVVKKSHCSALAMLEAKKKRLEEEAQLKLAQLAAQIAAIKTLESNGFSISKA